MKNRPLVTCPKVDLQWFKCSPGLKGNNMDRVLTDFLAGRASFRRAGIIPYYVDPVTRQCYYFIGYNRGKFADFGGGCEKSERKFKCALREYTEETRGVLDLTNGVLTHAYLTGNQKPQQILLMVQMPSIDTTVSDRFLTTKPMNQYEKEMEAVGWLTYEDLSNYQTWESLEAVIKLAKAHL